MSDSKVNKHSKYDVTDENILSILAKELDSFLDEKNQVDYITRDSLNNIKGEDSYCPYCGGSMNVDNSELLYYNKKMLSQYINCLNIELLRLYSLITNEYDLADKLKNTFTESYRNFFKILVKINNLRIKIENK